MDKTNTVNPTKASAIENCHLLVGPEDSDKLKTIKTLLFRTKSPIPSDLNKVNKQVQLKRSLEIMHQPLCQNLKILGKVFVNAMCSIFDLCFLIN